MSNPDAEVEINEYMVACYGTTEYPEDMTGITLTAKNASESKSLTYEYKCREEDLASADEVSAVIPAIETKAPWEHLAPRCNRIFQRGICVLANVHSRVYKDT